MSTPTHSNLNAISDELLAIDKAIQALGTDLVPDGMFRLNEAVRTMRQGLAEAWFSMSEAYGALHEALAAQEVQA